MKRILILGIVALAITSCGCNNSTPDGAVDCACDLSKRANEAVDDGDVDEMMDIADDYAKWEKEVQDHIDAGDYSEREMDEALDASDCEI